MIEKFDKKSRVHCVWKSITEGTRILSCKIKLLNLRVAIFGKKEVSDLQQNVMTFSVFILGQWTKACMKVSSHMMNIKFWSCCADVLYFSLYAYLESFSSRTNTKKMIVRNVYQNCCLRLNLYCIRIPRSRDNDLGWYINRQPHLQSSHLRPYRLKSSIAWSQKILNQIYNHESGELKTNIN